LKISISRIHYPVTALGAGNRIGIWFQGCSIHCPGCISLDTWDFNRGTIDIKQLQEGLGELLRNSDGITISGGEPFDQFEQLHFLLQWFHENYSGDVLVYTGYPLESLKAKIEKTTGLIDILITDPYDSKAAQSLPLRGSDNQRLHLLTDRGRQLYTKIDDAHDVNNPTKLDIFFDENDTAWIAGIPKKGDMDEIEKKLFSLGVKGRTSQAKINRLA
jgi:anaerobic ribonucleoside-triphosphate reductase activating protein